MPTYCEPKNHDGVKVDDIAEKTTSHGIEVHNEIKIDTIAELTPNNGVVIDSVTIKDGGIPSASVDLITSGNVQTDTIIEKTSANGVDVDSVVLKDGGLTATSTIDTSGSVTVDTINEHTSGAGVTIDGALFKDKALSIDTITESTPSNGVDIESVTFKDGNISLANNSHLIASKASSGTENLFKINGSDEWEFGTVPIYKSSHTTTLSGDTGKGITSTTKYFEEWVIIADQIHFQLDVYFTTPAILPSSQFILLTVPDFISNSAGYGVCGVGMMYDSSSYDQVYVRPYSSVRLAVFRKYNARWPGANYRIRIMGRFTST